MARPFRSLLFAPLFLPLAAAGLAQTTAKPEVFAAWSQLTGATAVPLSNDFSRPGTELRFAVPPGADCGQLIVGLPGLPPEGAKALGMAATLWADEPLDVQVCRVVLDNLDWTRAQAYYASDGTPVTLTSLVNLNSQQNDAFDPGKYSPGPSDGQPVILPGDAWIGQYDDLRIVTLGDTGCKGDPQRGGRQSQTCANAFGAKMWPFLMMAEQASVLNDPKAGRAPDLVIHVGDYRYFWEDSFRQQDKWDLWRKDFFPVAQPLLLAAPWVFTRGNHEGCPGAYLAYGTGYFQFFGTDSARDCTTLSASDPYAKPWFFDVKPAGPSGEFAHRFVVLDANNYDGAIGASETQAATNFRTALAMTRNGPGSSWWVSHSPAVTLLNFGGSNHGGEPAILAGLLGATDARVTTPDLRDRFCGGAAGCQPSQFLNGHQHLYQDVTFAGQNGDWQFPRAFIVGHGGVDNDTGNPAQQGGGDTCDYSNFAIGPMTGTTKHGKPIYGDVKGQVTTVQNHHGMVFWTRGPGIQADQSGWAPQYYWADPSVIAPVAPKTVKGCR